MVADLFTSRRDQCLSPLRTGSHEKVIVKFYGGWAKFAKAPDWQLERLIKAAQAIPDLARDPDWNAIVQKAIAEITRERSQWMRSPKTQLFLKDMPPKAEYK